MSKRTLVMVELAIVGLLVGTAVAVSVSCGDGPTVSPSQVVEAEQPSSSTTPVVVPPTGTVEGQRSFEAEFLSDGSVNVKNNLKDMGWPSVVYHDCTAVQPCNNEIWRDTKGVPPGGVVRFGPPPAIKFCSRLMQVDLRVDEKDVAWKFYDRRSVPCPDPTPSPSPTPTPKPTPTPSPTPTPKPSPSPTPSPTPPPGVCHVSNKGHDGNWNLVLSWKQSGVGHELHLDRTKFCPPDQLVKCDCAKAVADAIACAANGVPGQRCDDDDVIPCKIEGTRR